MCTNCVRLRTFESLVFDGGLSNLRAQRELETQRGRPYRRTKREAPRVSRRSRRRTKARRADYIGASEVVYVELELQQRYGPPRRPGERILLNLRYFVFGLSNSRCLAVGQAFAGVGKCTFRTVSDVDVPLWEGDLDTGRGKLFADFSM